MTHSKGRLRARPHPCPTQGPPLTSLAAGVLQSRLSHGVYSLSLPPIAQLPLPLAGAILPAAQPSPFSALAVTPLLSARCQESSKHRGSAWPSPEGGSGQRAQPWLTARLSLSPPGLVHVRRGRRRFPLPGGSRCPAPGGALPVGSGEPQWDRGPWSELLHPSGLGHSPCLPVQGCWGLSQGGLFRGWGIPWVSCREEVLHPPLQPRPVPMSFPWGQDGSCPAPTGRFRCPRTHLSALSLQGRHQINVHLVGVTPSPRLGTWHQPGANLTQAQRWQGLGRVGAAPPRQRPACPRACSPHTGSLVGSARPRSAHGAAAGLHRRRRLLRAGLFPGSADPARASRGPQRLCGCLVESRAAALRHSDHCAWATLAPETSLGPPRLLPPCLMTGSESKGFFAGKGLRPGGKSSSRSRDRESHDRLLRSVSPDGGRERGAAGTRRSQRWADSEPRHRAVPGRREGLPLHGSSARRPRHGLFAHAGKRALARHVLLVCSLSHLGHAVGMESCSHGTHGKG